MTNNFPEPVNPDFEHAVRDSFSRQGVMDTIGARMGLVVPGRCEIELPFHDGVSQQDGFFHGGMICTIADSAAGYAAMTLMPAGARVLTVEYKMNFLKPGAGDKLVARGEVLHPEPDLTVCRGDVYVQKGGAESLCAASIQTLICLMPK